MKQSTKYLLMKITQGILPVIGFLIVSFIVYETHHTSIISEKIFRDSINQQEHLRNIMWLSLLTQRATVLTLSPTITKDTSQYEQAQRIASTLPDLLKEKNIIVENVETLPKVTSIIESINKVQESKSLNKVAAIKLVSEVEELGIQLNSEESQEWFSLLANNENLLKQAMKRRTYNQVTYGIFLVYLLVLGWFSYINRKLDKEVREKTQLLLSAEAKVISTAKMSALGEMAGGVAHEINTPLATIGLLAEQLEECVEKSPFPKELAAKSIKRINETVARIAQIITSLRTFSRDGSHDDFMSSPIKQIIDNTLILCAEKLKNNDTTIEVLPFDENLEITCRPVQVSQVLLNLINNACDAIQPLEDKWIKVSVEKVNNGIELCIVDSGKGIPKEVREKLFQPFFTTKPIGKGTGLGLSISKGIMDSHKAEMSIDANCPNTKFVLRFPDASAFTKAA